MIITALCVCVCVCMCLPSVASVAGGVGLPSFNFLSMADV